MPVRAAGRASPLVAELILAKSDLGVSHRGYERMRRTGANVQWIWPGMACRKGNHVPVAQFTVRPAVAGDARATA